MSIFIKQKSRYQLVPEGTYQARLANVRELGSQDTPYGKKDRLQFEWDISPQGNSDGAAYRVTRSYTASFSRESALTRDLTSWLQIVPNENLDLEVLVGKRATLVIRHNEATTYSNIVSVLPASTEKIS